jgi:hypothetical protein
VLQIKLSDGPRQRHKQLLKFIKFLAVHSVNLHTAPPPPTPPWTHTHTHTHIIPDDYWRTVSNPYSQKLKYFRFFAQIICAFPLSRKLTPMTTLFAEFAAHISLCKNLQKFHVLQIFPQKICPMCYVLVIMFAFCKNVVNIFDNFRKCLPKI